MTNEKRAHFFLSYFVAKYYVFNSQMDNDLSSPFRINDKKVMMNFVNDRIKKLIRFTEHISRK